ncbi:E3 ubiquitin-protein ligase NEURL3-like [Misgurnus anguillicaudatus]|uniref:E3 ubiquitin-protein ligase NEURL3-like n=1 Tax=Misgurnus anguillicaudatus TaxID=75329 RepID=UPI003CCF80E6
MTAKKKEKQRQMMTNDSVYRCVCHKRTSLGPLSFHSNVNGRLITLSDGGRRATRDESSFRHGLVFSARPVQIQEKLRLRVESSTGNWQGSLRVGFANVLPEETKLPSLAVPDLTDSSSMYAAALLPEDKCYPGSEMEFWIDSSATLWTRSSDGTTFFQTALNIHGPIWAMIDIYGQTTAVMLLGSEKKGLLGTYRSCPALKHTDDDNCVYGDIKKETLERLNKPMSMQIHESDNTGTEAFDSEDCVVCYSEKTNILLSCGHKCVCTPCATKIYELSRTCPLCRQCIQPIQFS